jgi:hypothetical protein
VDVARSDGERHSVPGHATALWLWQGTSWDRTPAGQHPADACPSSAPPVSGFDLLGRLQREVCDPSLDGLAAKLFSSLSSQKLLHERMHHLSLLGGPAAELVSPSVAWVRFRHVNY